jgi:hypothetical protein
MMLECMSLTLGNTKTRHAGVYGYLGGKNGRRESQRGEGAGGKVRVVTLIPGEAAFALPLGKISMIFAICQRQSRITL